MTTSPERLLAAHSIFTGIVVLMLGEIVRFLHNLFVQNAYIAVREIAPYYSTPGTTWLARVLAVLCVAAGAYFWMLARRASDGSAKHAG